MSDRLIIVLAAAFIWWSPGALSAESPEALAEQYFRTMQTEGLTAVSRFMHPSALAEFKSMLVPIYEAEAAAGQSQLRDLTFGPDVPLEAVLKTEPDVFMSSFMNLIIAQTGEATLSFDKQEVLGVVEEKEQRHVLTRMTMSVGGIQVSQFEVLSFIPFNDTWRLQLNGQMQGLVAALAAGIRDSQE